MVLGIEYVFRDFENMASSMDSCLNEESFQSFRKKLSDSYLILEQNLTSKELEKVQWAFEQFEQSYNDFIKQPTDKRNIDSLREYFEKYLLSVRKLFEELRDIEDISNISREFN